MLATVAVATSTQEQPASSEKGASARRFFYQNEVQKESSTKGQVAQHGLNVLRRLQDLPALGLRHLVCHVGRELATRERPVACRVLRDQLRKLFLRPIELADELQDRGMLLELDRLRPRGPAQDARHGVRRFDLRHLIAQGHEVEATLLRRLAVLGQQALKGGLLPHERITGILKLEHRARRHNLELLQCRQEPRQEFASGILDPCSVAVGHDKRLCNGHGGVQNRVHRDLKRLELIEAPAALAHSGATKERVVPVEDDDGLPGEERPTVASACRRRQVSIQGGAMRRDGARHVVVVLLPLRVLLAHGRALKVLCHLGEVVAH
mmetsp:Transcript_25872/g.74564  ORF Transcript_25872/g.74564 Transcript_25872/m.74564 type:complete len:323 (+) Transcript_25872:57-1025(+)